MPRALDPNQTTEVILASDKADENPARFIYKALNCREWKEKHKRWQEAANKPAEEQVDELIAVAKIGLIDWKIDGRPFDPAELDTCITPFEANEITAIHLWGERLDAEDKKNSVSPHSSNGDSSAATAHQENVSTKM